MPIMVCILTRKSWATYTFFYPAYVAQFKTKILFYQLIEKLRILSSCCARKGRVAASPMARPIGQNLMGIGRRTLANGLMGGRGWKRGGGGGVGRRQLVVCGRRTSGCVWGNWGARGHPGRAQESRASGREQCRRAPSSLCAVLMCMYIDSARTSRFSIRLNSLLTRARRASPLRKIFTLLYSCWR